MTGRWTTHSDKTDEPPETDVPAVAYVRMSTDHQKYSTENQLDVIRNYATARGLQILRVFEDSGRSGLRLDGREALQNLMAEVRTGQADFKAILVYDVSRWGRFQDADEGAYHEHVCSRAGIRVHYCGEQFENDGSIGSNLLKTVKRVMAGEYSRELSVKVFAGQCRLADIEDGLVDVVVVYKIDRLSRSLMDFSQLVEVFDRNGVTFVSVTQSFNTTTSMGRLTLNILLSFAQFEREVTGERIRDKIAASRRKGMWMGGVPPYGYRVEDRKLLVDEALAAHVRWIFAQFLEIGSATELAREIAKRGIRTPHGNRIDKKFLYRMLNNRAYIGEAVHKGASYPGEHDAIIEKDVWDKVHAILTESPRKRAARTRAETPALLKGLLYGPDGASFSPTHTRKGGRLYRYYVSQSVLKHGAGSCPVGRVPAGEIEAAVINQLRAVFRQPEIIVGTLKAARAQDTDITEADARDALQQLDPLWDELFPAEQARIVQLLVERVDIGTEGLNVRLRIDGLAGLAREMQASGMVHAA